MEKFHSSLELGQHGAKSLDEALRFAKRCGCKGAQPSCYMLQNKAGVFQSADEIRKKFAALDLDIDGISTHCVAWVHGTAHTGSPTIRPFLPEDLYNESVETIEAWAEGYMIDVMNLSVELGRKVLPLFFGLYQGLELASGYPWGFAKGPGYDLVQEGRERFVKKTERIRAHARSIGVKLAHEIHPNSYATTAQEFLDMRKDCDDDECLGVFADPSHCWEGESFETRFTAVGPYIYGAHAKDFKIVRGRSLRMANPDWTKRAMHFTRLGTGDVDLHRYVEILLDSGLHARWNELHRTKDKTVPLCAEAESAHVELDEASAHGVRYVKEQLCYKVAQGSFEEGMGT